MTADGGETESGETVSGETVSGETVSGASAGAGDGVSWLVLTLALALALAPPPPEKQLWALAEFLSRRPWSIAKGLPSKPRPGFFLTSCYVSDWGTIGPGRVALILAEKYRPKISTIFVQSIREFFVSGSIL